MPSSASVDFASVDEDGRGGLEGGGPIEPGRFFTASVTALIASVRNNTYFHDSILAYIQSGTETLEAVSKKHFNASILSVYGKGISGLSNDIERERPSTRPEQ